MLRHATPRDRRCPKYCQGQSVNVWLLYTKFGENWSINIQVMYCKDFFDKVGFYLRGGGGDNCVGTLVGANFNRFPKSEESFWKTQFLDIQRICKKELEK